MTAIKEEIVNQGHGWLTPSLFAIHSTANPGATARNHRDLWSRGYAYAVHLVSDWREAIHCVPYDRLCWQVGNGNGTCEGIEICEATNSDDFWRGIDIAADVVAQRLRVHGWGADRMHPHQWFSQVYGGSDHTDPIPYFTRFGYSWGAFVNLVNTKLQGGETMSAADVWTYNWNNTARGGNCYNALMNTGDNAELAANLAKPRFIGAKDTAERLLWIPGQGIIPLYEPSEMAEMANDYKNITGYIIPTILYATAKQMHYAIAILNNEDAATRKKLKP